MNPTTPSSATNPPVQVIVGNRLFSLPFIDLLRPLHTSELQALVDSIHTNGVVCPVIIDEQDNVIDGSNRVRIAAELKLTDIPVEVRLGLSEDEKAVLALDLNDARRHLSAEDRLHMQQLRKERISRIVEARKQGASLRTIAEKEGVSVGQVQRDLCEVATVSGDTVEPEDGKVKGRDGRTRSAKKTKLAERLSLFDPAPEEPVIVSETVKNDWPPSQAPAPTDNDDSGNPITQESGNPKPRPQKKTPKNRLGPIRLPASRQRFLAALPKYDPARGDHSPQRPTHKKIATIADALGWLCSIARASHHDAPRPPAATQEEDLALWEVTEADSQHVLMILAKRLEGSADLIVSVRTQSIHQRKWDE